MLADWTFGHDSSSAIELEARDSRAWWKVTQHYFQGLRSRLCCRDGTFWPLLQSSIILNVKQFEEQCLIVLIIDFRDNGKSMKMEIERGLYRKSFRLFSPVVVPVPESLSKTLSTMSLSLVVSNVPRRGMWVTHLT